MSNFLKVFPARAEQRSKGDPQKKGWHARRKKNVSEGPKRESGKETCSSTRSEGRASSSQRLQKESWEIRPSGVTGIREEVKETKKSPSSALAVAKEGEGQKVEKGRRGSSLYLSKQPLGGKEEASRSTTSGKRIESNSKMRETPASSADAPRRSGKKSPGEKEGKGLNRVDERKIKVQETDIITRGFMTQRWVQVKTRGKGRQKRGRIKRRGGEPGRNLEDNRVFHKLLFQISGDARKGAAMRS